ncbi:MAG: hypothetical protein P8X82_06600 [Gemmatimonadales bacterium]|jgi:uracil phosphoribosyltransferase
MTDLSGWLDKRLGDAPPSLRTRILHAIRSAHTSESSLREALEEVARGLLDEAKSGPPNHDTALTLLAADALITYSCELAAETEPQTLAEL